MWETIGEILTSSNAFIVLIFLTVIVIVAVILIKGGYINFDSESLKINHGERERNIIRQQQDYVWLHLQEAEANLPKPEGYDKNLGQVIILSVYKEYDSWITFNHISKSEAYIRVKQKRLIALINSLTVKEDFKTEDFIEMIKRDTKETIYELIEIREAYSK